jgi:hypothetical protein
LSFKKRRLDLTMHHQRAGEFEGDFETLTNFVREAEAERFRSHQRFSQDQLDQAMKDFQQRKEKK